MDDFKTRARRMSKGHLFEDFAVGQTFTHHWGRTITESDTLQFSTLTLSFNPMYFNRDYAKKHGHPDIVINPTLLFNVTIGLSVEDLSEIGGPFLGVFGLTYLRPAYPGATIYSRSTTIETRLSASNPGNGIVTWESEGLDEAGLPFLHFRRSNLVKLRNSSQPTGVS